MANESGKGGKGCTPLLTSLFHEDSRPDAAQHVCCCEERELKCIFVTCMCTSHHQRFLRSLLLVVHRQEWPVADFCHLLIKCMHVEARRLHREAREGRQATRAEQNLRALHVSGQILLQDDRLPALVSSDLPEPCAQATSWQSIAGRLLSSSESCLCMRRHHSQPGNVRAVSRASCALSRCHSCSAAFVVHCD